MATRRRSAPRTIQVTLPRVALARKPAAKPAARRRSNTVAVTRWGGRWAWRGTRWGARKVWRSSARVVEATAYPPLQRVFRMRSLVAKHGFGHTFFVDGGHVRTLRDVERLYGDFEHGSAAEVRWARHQHAMFSHMLRHDTHHEHVASALDRSAERLRQIEFEHVRAQQQAQKGAPSTGPSGPRLVPVQSQGEDMATTADFANLADPGIDPLQFEEQLPGFLQEAEGVITDAAGSMSEMAEYFSAVPDLDPAIVTALNEIADAYQDAVTHIKQAQQATANAYGDFTRPKFERVG